MEPKYIKIYKWLGFDYVLKETRILHVVPILGYGGVETIITSIHKNLNPNKIQFDYFTYNKAKQHYKEKILDLGGQIYEPQINDKNYFIKIFRRFIRLHYFLKHKDYKIIHIHVGLNYKNIFHILMAKLAGVSIIIVHSHGAIGDIQHEKWKHILQKLLRPLVLLLATYYFACSKLAAEWTFSRKIVETGQVRIINNGIDAQKFVYNQQIRNKYRSSFGLENKFVIGHIGRFAYVKNHEFLIDIFHEIYKQNSQSVLLLIGEGKLTAAIKEKVKRLGLTGAVRFLGTRSDIAQLMQAMDVFLFPSRFEGLGIVAIEAQAAGLKVVASDVVPQEAKITNLLEYVSLKQRAYEWAKVILQYKNGYERRNTYNEIVKAGFDIHEIACELENFYLDVIGNFNAN